MESPCHRGTELVPVTKTVLCKSCGESKEVVTGLRCRPCGALYDTEGMLMPSPEEKKLPAKKVAKRSSRRARA